MTETNEPLGPCLKSHDKQTVEKRYCTVCQCYLPLQMFRPGNRKSKCIEHLREAQKKYVLGTADKRAFNALRCKARADMPLFQQRHMKISRREVVKMLTAAQIRNFSRFCLVPLRPDLPLTADNLTVVSSPERKFIVGNFRYALDSEKYQRDLRHILSFRNREHRSKHGAWLNNKAENMLALITDGSEDELALITNSNKDTR